MGCKYARPGSGAGEEVQNYISYTSEGISWQKTLKYINGTASLLAFTYPMGSSGGLNTTIWDPGNHRASDRRLRKKKKSQLAALSLVVEVPRVSMTEPHATVVHA